MEAGAPGELDRARVELLRAQIAFASTHGSDAPTMLLEAARRLTPLSPILAYETYLDALSAAMFAGRLAVPGRKRARRGAGREGRTEAARPRRPRVVARGLATLFSESYEAASRSCAGRRTRSTSAGCP